MQLGWVDFSREERDKALAILQALREQGAVDELGIGVVRDAFADRFFPGTSTLLTRAKYFLLVPYIMDEVIAEGARRGWTTRQAVDALDKEERKAGEKLWRQHREDKASGIIGQLALAHHGWVKRAPSELYWNGIRTLGISGERDLSLYQYIDAALSARRARGTEFGMSHRGEEDDGDDLSAGEAGDFKGFDFQGLSPREWRRDAGIALTCREAHYLCRKIEESIPGSVYAIVVRKRVDLSRFAGSFERFSAAMRPLVDAPTQRLMDLACRFIRTIYAARVRYNVLLQGDRVNEAKDCWAQIRVDSVEKDPEFVDEMFSALGLTSRYPALEHFLKELVLSFRDWSCRKTDALIRARERAIKGAVRAKLDHPERCSPDIWIGGKFLDYRLGVVTRLVSDIDEGERTC